MQVEVNVLSVHTNFDGCCHSGFGDIATFKNGQISLSEHGLSSAESSYPNDEIFCPAPPVLSISDRASASPPVGHLDDINTYVAEKLLQYIDEVNIGIFESLFQVRRLTLLISLLITASLHKQNF